jgi:hypothetical protein
MTTIREEIDGLGPGPDTARIVRSILDSLLPPVGAGFVLDLVYTISLMRVMGQFEGAAAVDRNGRGKVHRDGDRRADDTIRYLTGWIYDGADSAAARTSAAEIERIHQRIGQRYAMSNETFVHTLAYFTIQLECLTEIVGAPGFSDHEREAQVRHWRTIGAYLGVRDMPDSWDGMRQAVWDYESAPEWFGFSAAGHGVAEALVRQFAFRCFPRGLRWLARPLALSLHDDHVLTALGMRKPAPAVVATIRAVGHAAVFVVRRLPPPRGVLSAAAPGIATGSSRASV